LTVSATRKITTSGDFVKVSNAGYLRVVSRTCIRVLAVSCVALGVNIFFPSAFLLRAHLAVEALARRSEEQSYGHSQQRTERLPLRYD
jgi:hypothetical protein